MRALAFPIVDANNETALTFAYIDIKYYATAI